MSNSMANRELTPEEAKELTKDMQAVLEKHDCDMGVIATISLTKRVEESVISPIQPDGDNEEKTDKEA